MKKLFIFIFAIFTLILPTACGDTENEELETDIPATFSEIQGTWEMERNGTYFRFVFTKYDYMLTVRNVFATDPHTTQTGTYEMEGNVITLTPDAGDNIFSPLTAYWATGRMDVLNLLPMGAFVRQP